VATGLLNLRCECLISLYSGPVENPGEREGCHRLPAREGYGSQKDVAVNSFTFLSRKTYSLPLPCFERDVGVSSLGQPIF